MNISITTGVVFQQFLKLAFAACFSVFFASSTSLAMERGRTSRALRDKAQQQNDLYNRVYSKLDPMLATSLKISDYLRRQRVISRAQPSDFLTDIANLIDIKQFLQFTADVQIFESLNVNAAMIKETFGMHFPRVNSNMKAFFSFNTSEMWKHEIKSLSELICDPQFLRVLNRLNSAIQRRIILTQYKLTYNELDLSAVDGDIIDYLSQPLDDRDSVSLIHAIRDARKWRSRYLEAKKNLNLMIGRHLSEEFDPAEEHKDFYLVFSNKRDSALLMEDNFRALFYSIKRILDHNADKSIEDLTRLFQERGRSLKGGMVEVKSMLVLFAQYSCGKIMGAQAALMHLKDKDNFTALLPSIKNATDRSVTALPTIEDLMSGIGGEEKQQVANPRLSKNKKKKQMRKESELASTRDSQPVISPEVAHEERMRRQPIGRSKNQSVSEPRQPGHTVSQDNFDLRKNPEATSRPQRRSKKKRTPSPAQKDLGAQTQNRVYESASLQPAVSFTHPTTLSSNLAYRARAFNGLDRRFIDEELLEHERASQDVYQSWIDRLIKERSKLSKKLKEVSQASNVAVDESEIAPSSRIPGNVAITGQESVVDAHNRTKQLSEEFEGLSIEVNSLNARLSKEQIQKGTKE